MPKSRKTIAKKKPVIKSTPKKVKASRVRAPKIAVKLVIRAAAKGPQATVVGVDGKSVGKMSLPGELFAAKINKQLLAQAIRVYSANQRAGSASTKTRGQVEGSTRKIYRQKGTGRARHGGIRAPIFVGGGITFGPHPRDYSKAIPKKMKRQALASALTAQFQDGNIRIVEGFETLKPKTKFMAKALEAVTSARPALLVVIPGAKIVVRIARNIEGVEIIQANAMNPYATLAHKSLVFMKQAIPILKDTFVGKD